MFSGSPGSSASWVWSLKLFSPALLTAFLLLCGLQICLLSKINLPLSLSFSLSPSPRPSLLLILFLWRNLSDTISGKSFEHQPWVALVVLLFLLPTTSTMWQNKHRNKQTNENIWGQDSGNLQWMRSMRKTSISVFANDWDLGVVCCYVVFQLKLTDSGQEVKYIRNWTTPSSLKNLAYLESGLYQFMLTWSLPPGQKNPCAILQAPL